MPSFDGKRLKVLFPEGKGAGICRVQVAFLGEAGDFEFVESHSMSPSPLTYVINPCLLLILNIVVPNILPSSNTSSKLNQTKIKTLHAFNPLSEFYQSTNSLVRYQPNRTSCQGKLQVQIRLPHIRYAEHHAQGSRTK